MDLMKCEFGTIKKIMKLLPSDTMLELSKKTNLTEPSVYNIMKEMRKAKWLTYIKVGRTNKITLLEPGKRLKEAMEFA